MNGMLLQDPHPTATRTAETPQPATQPAASAAKIEVAGLNFYQAAFERLLKSAGTN